MARSYARARQTSYDRALLAYVKPGARRRGRKSRWVGVGLGVAGALGQKSRVIVITAKGALRKHGYSIGKSEVARHRALAKAVKEYGALSVYRKLNAQFVFRINRNPEVAERFKADAEWVKSNFPLSR